MTQISFFPRHEVREAWFGPLRWSAHESPWFRYCRVTASLWLMFVAFSFYPALAFIRGPLRRYRRRKRGLCLTCGYNLTGNTSGICPECGEPT